jgi:hypothetical protein
MHFLQTALKEVNNRKAHPNYASLVMHHIQSIPANTSNPKNDQPMHLQK